MYENFAPETAKGNLLSCLGWTDGVDGVLDTQMVVGGECLQTGRTLQQSKSAQYEDV